MSEDEYMYLIGFIGAATMAMITAVLVVGSMVAPDPVAVFLLLAGALLTGTLGTAIISDGYSRRGWDRLVGFDHPPLEDRRPYEGDDV